MKRIEIRGLRTGILVLVAILVSCLSFGLVNGRLQPSSNKCIVRRALQLQPATLRIGERLKNTEPHCIVADLDFDGRQAIRSRHRHHAGQDEGISVASSFTSAAHFALLIWRVYTELANADECNTYLSYLSTASLYLLQLLNIGGLAVSLLKDLKYKSVLKRIVVLNMIRELLELCGNVYTYFTLVPSPQRDFILGSIFTGVWITFAHYAIIRSTWKMKIMNPGLTYKNEVRSDMF
jgi:hypothetical protein